MKANTNKCLGPVGNGTGNTTRMEIQDCNGSNDQAWNITADANTGAFQLRNVAANRCLDVSRRQHGQRRPDAALRLPRQREPEVQAVVRLLISAASANHHRGPRW